MKSLFTIEPHICHITFQKDMSYNLALKSKLIMENTFLQVVEYRGKFKSAVRQVFNFVFLELVMT